MVKMEVVIMGYELDFLPVGENSKAGDAITFRFWNPEETEENQIVCLVDGGYAVNGEKIQNHIKKFYKTNKIDLVISTHPDADHAGGLKYILENMEVGKLWLHRPWHRTQGIADLFKDGRVTDNSVKEKLKAGLDSVHELEQIALEKKIEIKDPFAGLNEFNSAVYVLSPSEEYYDELLLNFRSTPEPASESKGLFKSLVENFKKIIESWDLDNLSDDGETSAENNSSVVLLLKFDNKYFLLTADAGIPALNQAADKLETLGLSYSDISYIQVPHHGSRRNVGPLILNRLVGPIVGEGSVIKRGCVSISKEDNPKHPSKAVLNAFKRRGVGICNTKGGNICKHSDDIPIRENYSTAPTYDFFEAYEVAE